MAIRPASGWTRDTQILAHQGDTDSGWVFGQYVLPVSVVIPGDIDRLQVTFEFSKFLGETFRANATSSI
jgi:hypothetical protein